VIDLLEQSDVTCGCGHVSGAHAHCRAGTDCALCDCASFRQPLATTVRRVRRAGRTRRP